MSTIALDLLRRRFELAVETTQNLPENGAIQPSIEQRFRCYGLYKQATCGPCTLQPPTYAHHVCSMASMRSHHQLHFRVCDGADRDGDPLAQWKYEAWRSQGDTPAELAMQDYIAELYDLILSVDWSLLPADQRDHITSFSKQMDILTYQQYKLQQIEQPDYKFVLPQLPPEVAAELDAQFAAAATSAAGAGMVAGQQDQSVSSSSSSSSSSTSSSSSAATAESQPGQQKKSISSNPTPSASAATSSSSSSSLNFSDSSASFVRRTINFSLDAVLAMFFLFLHFIQMCFRREVTTHGSAKSKSD